MRFTDHGAQLIILRIRRMRVAGKAGRLNV